MALEILRNKGLLDTFIAQLWPNGLTQDGKRRTVRYDNCYQEWKNSSDRGEGESEEAEETESGSEGDKFAYEADLRDYLAQNPGVLEKGMSLWDVNEGQTATEFKADDNGRRIDILAKDRNGVPVVVELKVSKGHEKVIGQILYYRECIKQKFGVPSVRMMIVARDISHELRLAANGISDIDLFEYRLSMTLMKV